MKSLFFVGLFSLFSITATAGVDCTYETTDQTGSKNISIFNMQDTVECAGLAVQMVTGEFPLNNNGMTAK